MSQLICENWKQLEQSLSWVWVVDRETEERAFLWVQRENSRLWTLMYSPGIFMKKQRALWELSVVCSSVYPEQDIPPHRRLSPHRLTHWHCHLPSTIPCSKAHRQQQSLLVHRFTEVRLRDCYCIGADCRETAGPKSAWLDSRCRFGCEFCRSSSETKTLSKCWRWKIKWFTKWELM